MPPMLSLPCIGAPNRRFAGRFIRFSALAAALALLGLGAGRAAAQGGEGMTPLGTDLAAVPAGAWADYNVSMNDMKGKLRWALVEKTPASISVEMSVEGGMTAMIGGQRMISKLVLEPDPMKAAQPVKRMMVQMGDQPPMELPRNDPRVTGQKFSRPDPKNLVKKETIKVPGGSFATSHYREARGQSVVNMWINETVHPLGLVKMTGEPEKGGVGPKVSMELAAKGGDAKPLITKEPKPIDPSGMMGGGMMGGGPPPAAAPAAKPGNKPAKSGGKAKPAESPSKQ